jgi:eukaryotic-like serine/threonine-protein kinase
MNAPGNNAQDPSTLPAGEPDGVRDELIPLLESYEEALRQGDGATPEQWLLRGAGTAKELRTGLDELYWLHQGSGNGSAPPAIRASGMPSIPGHVVLEVLRRGGMGVVYRARQLAANRIVALKMLVRGDLTAPEDVVRFRKEPEAVARLQHAHVVQIYEVGEHDGHPYFSMEFLAGGSLDAKLGGNPQPPAWAAQLVMNLAQAIAAAHAGGIVHRDLKPSNVLFTTDGAAKIIDFGLAKRLDLDSGQTKTGSAVGTPSYMAPEQAAGDLQAVGPMVDVYALGAVLYEVLTGRPPFRGSSPLETMEQVRSGELLPPARLQPGIPRDLETICLKCLEKDPAKRYARAADVAEDLRRFLACKPIRARRTSPLGKLWRWSRRNPWVAALLCLIIVGAAVAFIKILAASRAETAARKQAEQDRERTLEVVDRFFTQVSENEDLKAQGLESLRRELLVRAQEFYRKLIVAYGGEPRLRADLARTYRRLATITSEIGSTDEALSLYGQALEQAEEVAGEAVDKTELEELIAQIQSNLAGLHRRIGQRQKAEEAYGKTLAISERLVGDHPDDVKYQLMHARCQLHLGFFYVDTFRPHLAREHLPKALESYAKLRDVSPTDKVIRQEMAQTYHYLGRINGPPDGEAFFRQAVAIQEMLTAEYPKASEFRRDLANSCYSFGLYWFTSFHEDDLTSTTFVRAMREAETWLKKALPLWQDLARQHPLVHGHRNMLARTHGYLGTVYQETHQFGQAQEMYRKALPYVEQLANEHPKITVYLRDLAVTYGNLGDLMDAGKQTEAKLDYYARSITALEKWLNQDASKDLPRFFLVTVHGSRARVLSHLGRYAEAISDWERISSIDSSSDGALASKVAVALTRALLEHQQMPPREAETLVETACTQEFTKVAQVYAFFASEVLPEARLPDSDRKRAVDQYASLAVRLLQKARVAGELKGKKLYHLKQFSDLPVLGTREDFKKLLANVEEDAKGGGK